MALRLTDALRDRLKAPYGRLHKGKGADCLSRVVASLGKPAKVISIGDMTTYYLIKAGIVPDMCLVDDTTMRLPVEAEIRKGTVHGSFKEVRVVNPPGVVTRELMDAIRDNMDSREPVRIFVDGEEDLAVIPACIFAPVGSAVIYGQPGEGVVVVHVTEEKKKETLALMGQMAKV